MLYQDKTPGQHAGMMKGYDYMARTTGTIGSNGSRKRNQSAGSVTANQENNPDNTPVKRGRGRPAGSKNKIKITREDRTVQAEPGENSRYLYHDLKLSSLPAVDMTDPAAIQARINEYFKICADDDIKPSIESFALSFDMSRHTLYNLLNDRTRNSQITPEGLRTLQKAYNNINSYYAHMMNNGKINPVAGIFMMKNNLGYKDTSDYIITPGNEQSVSLQDITNRAGLLTDE